MNVFKKILQTIVKLALVLLSDETVVAMICQKQAKILKSGKSAAVKSKALKVIAKINTTAKVTSTYADAIAVVTDKPSAATILEAGSRLLGAWVKQEPTPEQSAKILEL